MRLKLIFLVTKCLSTNLWRFNGFCDIFDVLWHFFALVFFSTFLIKNWTFFIYLFLKLRLFCFEKMNILEYGLLESRNRLSRRFNLENRLGTSQLVESSQQPVKSLKTGFSPIYVKLPSHSKPDFSLKIGFFTNQLRSTLLPPAGPGEGDRLG